MGSISTIVLTGEHILVRVRDDSPFGEDAQGEDRLIKAVTFVKPQRAQPCWGHVLAVGPSPYLKNDYTEKEDKVKVGDVVLFPPTSGFPVPAPEGVDDEYRIMAANVVAGIIPSTQAAGKHPFAG